jgi:2-haloacid dehalogenase
LVGIALPRIPYAVAGYGAAMTSTHDAVAVKHALFDLNGTLLDPSAMAEELPAADARGLADAILGDAVLSAMVETMTGEYREFSELIEKAAARRLAIEGMTERLEQVTEAARRMKPFPDAQPAIDVLRAAGIGVGVLTNSATEAARSSLAAARLALDPVIGTDQVGAFKPDRRVYRRALDVLGARGQEVVLVTAHGWDALGAGRAGLRAAWIARKERARLELEPLPDFEAADLVGAADRIAAASGGR